MSKKHLKRESPQADQRWENDGGSLDESTDADPPRTTSEQRGDRWRTANDEHWHNAGYSEETKRRNDGG